MKHPDANDRFRTGLLPLDPREGTAPFAPMNGAASNPAAVEEPAPLPWRTLGEVAADAEANPRDWEWEGFLALRTVAVISGEPKSGKSEVLAGFVAAKTRGGEWLGKTLTKGKVGIITEEGDHDFVAKLVRYGADFDSVLVLSRDAVGSPPVWADLVTDAVEKAVAFGASILVIDTFSFWAAIEGDGERVEGIVREALIVLQRARNAGLATTLVHHNVKARDVEGIAALRGSGAFAASVESVGIFRRHSQSPEDSRRKLEVFSRIAACATAVIERVIPGDGGDPHFRLVEALTAKAPGTGAADAKIVGEVAKIGGWVERRAFEEATGLSTRTLDGRLPALCDSTHGVPRLIRMGRGVPGHAFSYSLPGTPAPVPGQPEATKSRAGKKAKRGKSATSAITAEPLQCGGSASADATDVRSLQPPTGGSQTADIARSADAEKESTAPDCGDPGRTT